MVCIGALCGSVLAFNAVFNSLFVPALLSSSTPLPCSPLATLGDDTDGVDASSVG